MNISTTKKTIISLGEIIWDMLPSGGKLGGAPLNFAWHAQQLGAEVTIVSRVGNDELGKQALEQLVEQGFSTNFIPQDGNVPTGQAMVELSASGTPTFSIMEDVAYDFIKYDPALIPQIQTANVIYFGSLAQRSETSRSTIHQYLRAAPETTVKIFDINLRPPFFNEEIIKQSLKLANALKLNDQELPVLVEFYHLQGSIKEQLASLASLCELKFIAYTRASEGSLIYAEGEWSDYQSIPVKVVDSVGAGDAFSAALVVGMIKKKELGLINEQANKIAGYVCTQAGATPVLPAEYKQWAL
jgi:fructokinase